MWLQLGALGDWRVLKELAVAPWWARKAKQAQLRVVEAKVLDAQMALRRGMSTLRVA